MAAAKPRTAPALCRWTCRCGTSNVASEAEKAAEDAAAHALSVHGVLAADVITMDTLTAADISALVADAEQADAALLGTTVEALRDMRQTATDAAESEADNG